MPFLHCLLTSAESRSSGTRHRLWRVRGWSSRARGLVAPAEVIEDAVDDGGLCDEADHAHFAAAARAEEGVDFVHPTD